MLPSTIELNRVGEGCCEAQVAEQTGNLVYDMREDNVDESLLSDADVYEAARLLDEERWFYRFVKRAFDIVFSGLVLVLFCWLYAIIAIAIKIDDPKGPVIFKQERVGKNGKRFMMWKFRSMYADAEKQLDSLMALNEKTGPVFKIARDPHIDSRIIETNARRPLSALVFVSVFLPKNTVVSATFLQLNVQIMHPAEIVEIFFAAKWCETAQFPKKLANRIFALLKGLNNHVRIPSCAAVFTQPASA